MDFSDAMTLTEASKIFPHRPNISTIWRWCRRGVGGIRLDYMKAGRRILVTPDGIESFCKALAAADRERDDQHIETRSAAPKLPKSRTDARRRRDIERAEKTLREAKIL